MTAGRPLWDKKKTEASEGRNAGKFDNAVRDHRITPGNFLAVVCDEPRRRCRFKRVWIFLSIS
jgi:hypothetical protein